MSIKELQDDDLEMMSRPDMWVCRPVLPVKRYIEGHNGPFCAIMIEGLGPVVYEKGLFDLQTGALKPQLEGCVKHEYNAMEAVVADGWMVD